MNRVILIGRLTKDPEIRRIPSTGNAVISFTVAVDNFGRDQSGERRPASFIPCTIWGKQAENMAKYTRKGSNIAIEGRLNQRTYTRKDGGTAQVVEVMVDNVQFLDPKSGGNEFEIDMPAPVDLDQEPSQAVLDSNIADDEDLPF